MFVSLVLELLPSAHFSRAHRLADVADTYTFMFAALRVCKRNSSIYAYIYICLLVVDAVLLLLLIFNARIPSCGASE